MLVFLATFSALLACYGLHAAIKRVVYSDKSATGSEGRALIGSQNKIGIN